MRHRHPEPVEGLDRDGFVVLERLIDAAQIAAMLARIDELLERARGDLTKKHGGTLHLDGLDGEAAFGPALRSPRLRDAVAQILGPEFSISAATYRGPKPGHGAQALHTDDVPIAAGEAFRVATAIVALVDFTERNGATRVVPASHREPMRDTSPEPGRAHPRERPVTMRAGDALVINGHLWHSGTCNRSEHRRDALQITFRV
jgi:ectoine hydroxylase-related dioxygenase (phytanoyl-CoA dioxygenase family)